MARTETSDNEVRRSFYLPRRGKIEPRGVEGMLALIWLSILDQLKLLDGNALHGMITDHILEEYELDDDGKDSDSKTNKLHSGRANTLREILSPKMTWKVLWKGICILKAIKLDVSFRLTFQSGKTVIVERTFYTNVKRLNGVQKNISEQDNIDQGEHNASLQETSAVTYIDE